jgi:AcrR family transcriptional regulator
MRRNDIIESAEKLFFSSGYENVSMDDIAKEMELARATLYLSFKNKDEIYIAIALKASRIISEMFKDICMKDDTGITKIRSICLAYQEFYKKYTGFYMAYYHTGMFESDSSPMLDELRAIRKESFRMVVDAVKKGIKDETISEDIDPTATPLIVLSMSNSALNISPVTRMYMDSYGLTQDEYYDRTVDMVVRSIENVKKS